MAQLSDKTLAWLWSVLQNGYLDPQATYSSAARTLSVYPTLSPRTEVYTHEHGTSALLLTLSGTLPVAFRGTTYRFPLKLWIPQAYPQEAPMVYITPAAGADMVVRPGQHVGVDGRVYHPYLRDWASVWDRASIEEFLGLLGQVFEREPPVISRSQQAQYQRPIGQVPQQQQGGAPPPPPKQRVESPAVGGDVPPPRPPKPGEEGVGVQQRVSSRNMGRDGPRLPPLPHERQTSGQYASPRPQQNGYAAPPRSSSQVMSPPGYQNGRPPEPPLPPVPGQQQHRYQQRRPQYEESPVSPVSPVAGYSELPETRYSRPAPLPPQTQQQPPPNHYQRSGPPPPQGAQYTQQPPQQYQRPPQQYPQQHPSQQPYQYLPHQMPPQQPPQPQKPQPPPDLLTDPFDIAFPSRTSTNQHPAPAPPIPPNPEKEHLLHALSSTLTRQLQQKISQNLSFLPALQAQNTALQTAAQNLEAELRQLSHLSSQLESNESILHASIAKCDNTIASARSKPQPNVDDVLIAPTVVGTQLWNACAEEAGAREAMYVLQRAVDRGRVGGSDFVRQMRALGRERFLRMVLARKCGRGLGLEVKGVPLGMGGGGKVMGN